MSPMKPTFTIRGLMIAVGVVAASLALPAPAMAMAAWLLFVGSAEFLAWWLHSRDLPGMAGLCFWIPATLVNGLYLALSLSPVGLLPEMLCLAWLLLVLPTLLGFGIAWARLATRGDGDRQAPTSRAWASAAAMILMPLVTAWTVWPFQVRFLLARPALERLADRVAAGQAIPTPVSAGPFTFAKVVLEPVSGNVGLMIDPSPSGPSGFVRCSGSDACHRVFRGDWYHLVLGGGWHYHEED